MVITKKKINKHLKNFFFITFFFFFSYILLKSYVLGDQIHYIKLYETFKASSSDYLINDFFSKSRGGAEPISYLLLFLGANLGIDKNIYISIWNVILIFGFFLILKRHQTPPYLIFFLLFNFYFIVLFTGAERLKFCYILIILGLLSKGKIRNTLILLSPLAHLQALLFLPSMLLIKYQENLKTLFFNLKIKKSLGIKIFLIILFFFIFYYIYGTVINRKVIFYIQYTEGLILRDIQKILIIFLLSLIITKKYFLMFGVTLPLFFATLIIGGFRINMIIVSIYFYIFLTEKKIKHPISLGLIFYLFIKSIFFIKNIFYNNDGFKGFLL